jgi:hypothetical protein
VKGTGQRLAGPSQRAQRLLEVLRTLVVQPSGSIFSSSAKSTSVPLARSLSARFVAACVTAILRFRRIAKFAS